MKTLSIAFLATYFLVFRTGFVDGLSRAGPSDHRSTAPRGLSFNGGLLEPTKTPDAGDLTITANQLDEPTVPRSIDHEADYTEADSQMDKRSMAVKPMKRVTGMMGFRRSTKAAWYLGKRSAAVMTPPTVVGVRSINPHSLKSARWLGPVLYFFRSGTVNRSRL
ncbi:hypothetical protein RvY_03933 [Ramazzottius varieornatus]|uniref:Uncharacterized protein n=1 Tax=Ramazzottius varieornatus TaxID=947166 RepID=A0A1D1UT92_RAMVA|nr:hypothetical protein RvY_03933 [Ramazzottius varieornatus]